MRFFTLQIVLISKEGMLKSRQLVLENDTNSKIATLKRIFGHCVKSNLPIVPLLEGEKVHLIEVLKMEEYMTQPADLVFSQVAQKLKKIVMKRKEEAERALAYKSLTVRFLESWNPN